MIWLLLRLFVAVLRFSWRILSDLADTTLRRVLKKGIRAEALLWAKLGLVFWWPAFVFRALRKLRATSGLYSPAGPPRTIALPGFPQHIPRYVANFSSFGADHRAESILHAIPWTAQDVLDLVGWAATNDWMVRPKGAAHSWSPAALPHAQTLVLDLRRFRKMSFDPGTQIATFGPGVTIEEASRFLRDLGAVLPVSPAIGDVTLGGALAMGIHGTGIDAVTPKNYSGATLSAFVHTLEVVALSRGGGARIRRITAAVRDLYSISLGSTIILELRVHTRPSMYMDMHVDTFLADEYLDGGPPRRQLWGFGRTIPQLSRELARSMDRLELFWFPAQFRSRAARLLRRGWSARLDNPTPVEREPARDALVNWATRETDTAFRSVLGALKAPSLGARFQGLTAFSAFREAVPQDTHAANLYASKFILNFHVAGWCVLTTRAEVPRAISRIMAAVDHIQRRNSSGSSVALDGPCEVRITSVDEFVALSPARPSNPSNDTAIWVNLLASLGDPLPDRHLAALLRYVEHLLWEPVAKGYAKALKQMNLASDDVEIPPFPVRGYRDIPFALHEVRKMLAKIDEAEVPVGDSELSVEYFTYGTTRAWVNYRDNLSAFARSDIKRASASDALAEFEGWLTREFCEVRPEWSKGWAYGPDGKPWHSDTYQKYYGRPGRLRKLAFRRLRALDPKSSMRSALLDVVDP